MQVLCGRSKVIAVLAASLLCAAGIYLLYCTLHTLGTPLVITHKGMLTISDFAYHMVLVKDFWLNYAGDIYQPSVQQQSLSRLLKTSFTFSMPVGVFPTALELWFPYAIISLSSIRLSQTLWNITSLAILLYSLVRIRQYFHETNRTIPLGWTLALVVAGFSHTAARSIALGQTAIWAVGLLMLLLIHLRQCEKNSERPSRVTICALMFGLSIKPTYFFLGLILLLNFNLISQAIIAVFIVLIGVLGVMPLLGLTGLKSYFSTLMLYSAPRLPDFYSQAIDITTMNNFRGAFNSILSSDLALRTGNIFLFMGLFILVILLAAQLFVFHFRNNPDSADSKKLATYPRLFVISLSLVLLIWPYLGQYEDLLLIVAISLPTIFTNCSWKSPQWVVIILSLLLCLNFAVILPGLPKLIFFIAKFILLAFVFFAKSSSEGLTPASTSL